MSQKVLILNAGHDILNVLKDLLEHEDLWSAPLNYTDFIINNIAKYNPDLVMLDFLLAGVNGGDLCHEIKINSQTSWMPVILLSAFPRVLDSLGNYGSDAFIAKPFDIDLVLKKVKDCLENRMAHA